MRKDGWFSWLVWDPCCAALPLWTLLVVSSRQPCRGGEGRGGPALCTWGAHCSAAPQAPLAHSSSSCGRSGGREKGRPLGGRGPQHHSPLDGPSNWPHPLSGLGVASLLFCAGLECGNQIPVPWCGGVGGVDIPPK